MFWIKLLPVGPWTVATSVVAELLVMLFTVKGLPLSAMRPPVSVALILLAGIPARFVPVIVSVAVWYGAIWLLVSEKLTLGD